MADKSAETKNHTVNVLRNPNYELKEANELKRAAEFVTIVTKKLQLKVFVQILSSVFLAEVNYDCSSVDYFCVQNCDEPQRARTGCVCVFLCTSSNILSAADAQAVGGSEEGSWV